MQETKQKISKVKFDIFSLHPNFFAARFHTEYALKRAKASISEAAQPDVLNLIPPAFFMSCNLIRRTLHSLIGISFYVEIAIKGNSDFKQKVYLHSVAAINSSVDTS